MSDMPEPGRQAAHVFLDMLSGFDPEVGDDPVNTASLNLALQRFNDVDAITATVDDETGEFEVTASNLIGGAIVTMNWMLSLLVHRSPLSREELIVKAREFVDDDSGD